MKTLKNIIGLVLLFVPVIILIVVCVLNAINFGTNAAIGF